MLDDALATMLTLTTHGASLSQEDHECVEHDLILPAKPIQESGVGEGARSSPFLLPRAELLYVGKLMGTAIQAELGLRIWALAVQVWYAHLVIAATREPAERIIACLDDALREGLDLKRPIWSDDYDQRFCFEAETVRQWIAYVERHNVAVDLPAKPWAFIETPPFA